MLDTLLKLLLGLAQDYRRLRFRSHWAEFAANGEKALFLTVTNLSRSREIEITHAWIDTAPQVSADQPTRPLPKRLRPDEIWETWIRLSDVAAAGGEPPSAIYASERPLRLGRLRLSTGRTIRAIPDRGVPAAGRVPGR